MGGLFLFFCFVFFPGGRLCAIDIINQCSQSVRGMSCCDTIFNYGIKQKRNHAIIVLVEKDRGYNLLKVKDNFLNSTFWLFASSVKSGGSYYSGYLFFVSLYTVGCVKNIYTGISIYVHLGLCLGVRVCFGTCR